ncbi:MAG: phosphate acyltransferase PlsX [Oscillospiraceae bacterium]|jgi:glycerol-3-phosphate acyltransferase PlsX|nr:phosphate acyltransferase PlsX [Oscillospiraceae bacterium]
MKIIVDAMGGDNAPEMIVKGAADAAREYGVDIVLTGGGEDILRRLEKLGYSDLPKGIEIAGATEVVRMDDDPSVVVRGKKDSSMSVGLRMLADGHGDAFVSAGSTGALLSGATLIVKRVQGIRRAALAPFVPGATGGFVLIDGGANVECTREYLVQFAFMGSYYAESVRGISNPRVALLNNGSEETKGTELVKSAYEALKAAGDGGAITFVGNVEAKDVFFDVCDVLVCDGFSGNIFLKSIEGMARFLMRELKEMYSGGTMLKLSGQFARKRLMELKARFDPDNVGGTALLGISKPVIKAHGSSNDVALRNAINQARIAAEANVADKLRKNMRLMGIGEGRES